MPRTEGARLRAWRRSRGWDVPETAARLRRAADETGQAVAAHDALVRMIYGWERGAHRVTERYELLYARALGTGADELAAGVRGVPAGPTLLGVLVRERHWRVFRTFEAQFRRAARELAEREQEKEIAKVSVSERTFERWYAGKVRTMPRSDASRVLEHMFGVPVAQLLGPADVAGNEGSEGNEAGQAPSPANAGVLNTGTEGGKGSGDPVKRRGFGIAAQGFLAGVPALAGGRAAGSGDPADGGQARKTIGAIAAALHGVAGDVPGRDVAQLDRDVMRAWRLRQSSQYAELGSLLVKLLREVGSVHAGTAQAVHVYNLASSMCKGVGAHDLSAILADRAYLSAVQDGSPLLIGAAKNRVANSYLAAGRHAEAVAVAAAAADDLPPGRASAPEEVATFGSLLLCAAVAAARMQESAQAWEFLGHARAATAVCDREHADVYAVFGPANLAIHGVQVATDLGDGREALRRAERADPGRLPAVLLERRTTLLVDIARAQHMQRDNKSAVETLLEAERVASLEVRYSGAALALVRGLLSAGPVSGDLRGLAGRLNIAA